MQTLIREDLYSQLEQLPESLTGEILNGQLYAHPRPGGKHVSIATNLSIDIGGPFHRGRGGPGGWRILVEPEVHLALDTDVVVPDVAGWRKERLPTVPEGHKFTVVPDWICEIFSPSTETIDKEIKMPLYAKYRVKYLWHIHPILKTLDAYKLENGEWITLGSFIAGERPRIEPFGEIEINVNELMD